MRIHGPEQSFVPIYQRLYEHNRSAIITQKHSPGKRIDSINEMQNKYSISRETAKSVLRHLRFIKNEIWAGRNLVQELMEKTFTNFVDENGAEEKAVVIDSIHTLTPLLLRERNIQGIFCFDDLDAMRLIGRLLEWNFGIPHDISIISYGNTELARYFSPKITSIDCHYSLMASKTAQIISDHLEGNDVSSCQYVIQPDLVIRDT